MGKGEQNLHHHQQQHQSDDTRNRDSSGFFSQRCSVVVSRISKEFNWKCALVLIFSLALSLSAIFWFFPLHRFRSGFDASHLIKRSASVQAFFKLQKPVSELIPHIEQLEYDIYEEIGVPYTKVAILSLHHSGAPNWTNVVFGVLSEPLNAPINPVSLSVLKSSLIELFLQKTNLTLTISIFGQPSAFQIWRFPGGVTVVPTESASIWQTPQVLFNFTLNNSIGEVEENFAVLQDQLRYGLHLRPSENVYVQVTNTYGSTISAPVTVQASIMSDLGGFIPQRLKQLAETISESPRKNLGLDNSVFGRVKSVILSSYLKGTLYTPPPTSSPSPSPEPSISPSYPRAPASHFYHHIPRLRGHHHRHALSPKTVHAPPPCPLDSNALPPSRSPSPSPTPVQLSPVGHPKLAPNISASPKESPGPTPSPATNNYISAPESSSPVPSVSSASETGLSYKKVWLVGFYGVLIFHILWWWY